MSGWILRAFFALFGAKLLKVEATTATWPKDAEHGAGSRFLRLYVSVLVLGRFMDFEVRL